MLCPIAGPLFERQGSPAPTAAFPVACCGRSSLSLVPFAVRGTGTVPPCRYIAPPGTRAPPPARMPNPRARAPSTAPQTTSIPRTNGRPRQQREAMSSVVTVCARGRRPGPLWPCGGWRLPAPPCTASTGYIRRQSVARFMRIDGTYTPGGRGSSATCISRRVSCPVSCMVSCPHHARV